jgi:hypothetical protein
VVPNGMVVPPKNGFAHDVGKGSFTLDNKLYVKLEVILKEDYHMCSHNPKYNLMWHAYKCETMLM